MKIQLNFETVQPGFVLILGPTKKCLRIKFMEVPPKYIYINMYIYIYIYRREDSFSLENISILENMEKFVLNFSLEKLSLT